MLRLALLTAALCGLVFVHHNAWPALAQEGDAPARPGLLMPIGGGYADTHADVVQTVLARNQADTVRILVMAASFSYDAYAITDDERADNTADAQRRVAELAQVCEIYAEAVGKTCEVTLAPLYIRADALAAEALAYFAEPLDAVYFLGGDQVVAMQIIAGTPVEEALAAAYESGTVIAGTSAGNAVQSRVMIAGYNGGYGPETGLLAGAVEVWNSGDERGLAFGVDNLVLDQHFFQRSRLGRLLNVITQPGVPGIGVGVDAYTGVVISDRATVGDAFGLYTVAVLDAETHNAAENARYVEGVLSVRDVVLHLLAPGAGDFDLTTRAHSLAPPPERAERAYPLPQLPPNQPVVILSGGLLGRDGEVASGPVLARFVEISGGAEARVLIVALGYSDESEAAAVAAAYGAALGVAYEAQPSAEAGYSGVLLVGQDVTRIDRRALSQLLNTYGTGLPVMADGAPAAVLSALFAVQPPTPDDPDAEEEAVQGVFLTDSTLIAEGLWWVDAMIEPNLLDDHRFGRLVALAYAYPNKPAIGLNGGTALEVTAAGVTVLGDNGVFLLDLSGATLAVGLNDTYAFANGLLDVYAPGESLPVR